MVDITAKLFWYRTKEWYEKMADKLSDLVYTDDSKETVDVINLLLLGWILLGLIVYIIGTVIATQLRKRKTAFSPSEVEISDEKPRTTDHHVSGEREFKSSAPEFLNDPVKLQKPLVIPTCSGDEGVIVEWINSVFSWIYKNRVVSPLIDAWISALNARTRLLSTEHGILVDFKDVAFTSGPPEIREALETCTTRGDLNVTCDLNINDANFEIAVTQVKEKVKTVTPFSLNVKRISGKVNVECLPEDLSFTAKYSETPQVELSAEPISEIATFVENSQTLNDVVCEITSEAIATAITDLKFSCYSDCPRLTLKSAASEEEIFESAENEAEEKLLVKIIKATNLGGKEGCTQPYCVVEMDEPPQKFETKGLEEKFNPFWDESFTFVVKDVSAELLFEIYDKGKPSKENFLGLGIVSVDELIKNPSQRQIIPLQSRPLEDDNVTGSLTTEFLFMNQTTPVADSNRLSPKTVATNGKTIETNSRVTAGGTVITTTTIKRTTEEHCGSLGTMSNLNANPIAELNLAPVHETSGDLVKTKNERNISLVAIAQEPDDNSNNGAKPAASINQINNKTFSNGHLLNGLHNSDLRTMVEDINEVNAKQNSPENNISESVTNGSFKFACQSVHVHDQTKNSAVLAPVIHKNFENLYKFNCIENIPVIELNNENESHGIVNNNNEDMIELTGEPERVSFNMSSELPTIAETEDSSMSSKSIENNDAEADLTGTALKELEKHSKPNSTSKSTLIIHSVQRGDSSISESLEASPASHLSKNSRTSYSESVPSSPSQDRSGDDRSRSKEKKSILGSIRRRLSFRKSRSKSAEHQSESSTYSQGSSRSASSDRLRSKGQKPSPIKGKFIGMNLLGVPGSTRSSLSEVSAISGSSSRTYINENSTLVIETNENGIIKRYLIPNSLIHRSKWKKRGTKLHIYNDHVFIAKHLSGSTICKVCQKYLTRRPGKQGYECRGCNLQCHKSCHVKVENFCANSSINSMEVEYIQDPKGATPKTV